MDEVFSAATDVEATEAFTNKFGSTLIINGGLKGIARQRRDIEDIAHWDGATAHLIKQRGSLLVVTDIVRSVSA